MRKTFLYRLYPTTQQRRLLEQQLEECRWLYNEMLAARRVAWEQRHESLSLYDQQAMLPALKVLRPALGGVQSQVLQNVAVRIDLAFKAFFRRMQTRQTSAVDASKTISGTERAPGYPRFRGKGRYDSLTFPQVPVGCLLNSDLKRVRIMRVGQVKVFLHRPLEGTPKTATIRRSSTGKWYITFSCECALPSPLLATGRAVGIDVGLTAFATLSTNQMEETEEAIDNPRFFRAEEQTLAKAQRRLMQAEKGTPERAQRRKVVARVHERIAWRRDDFTHQRSRHIVNSFDFIAVEDLAVQRMMHNHCLAKSIQDAAWTQFAFLLAYKAAWAGRQYVRVNPAYTSQDCSGCGQRQKLSLSDRIYTCPACGLVLDRDLNAARNIVALGQQCLASA
jgi:putative transposase